MVQSVCYKAESRQLNQSNHNGWDYMVDVEPHPELQAAVRYTWTNGGLCCGKRVPVKPISHMH